MRILNGNKRVIPSAGTISYWDSVTNDGGKIKSIAATQEALDMLAGYNAWFIDPHYSGYKVNTSMPVLMSKLYSIGNNIPIAQSGGISNQPVLGDFIGRKALVSNRRLGPAVNTSGGATANISPTISSYNTLEIGFTILPSYVNSISDPDDSISVSIGTRITLRFLNSSGNITLFIQGDNGGTPTIILNISGSSPSNFNSISVIYYKLTVNFTALTYSFQYSEDNNSFTTLNSGSITAAFKPLLSDMGINVDLRSGTATLNSVQYAYVNTDGTRIITFNPYDCAPNANSWTDTQGRSWSIQTHSGNNPTAAFVDKRNSVFYNGVLQFFQTSAPDSFFNLTGDFLISAVIKPSLWDSSNSRMALLSTASDSSATTGFMLEFGSADGFRLLNNGSTVLDDSTSSITGLTPNVNHYIRIQRSGTGSNNLQIYVDDVLRGQASYNGTIGASNILYVGANSSTQAGVVGFCGEIPSICVINGTWDSTIADKLRSIQTKHYQTV